jgi:hypothetical protein
VHVAKQRKGFPLKGNFMSFVEHSQLSSFADNYVNLGVSDVAGYRKQVENLREKLENYIAEKPSFELIKMLGSGSVAKGTALKTINDMDVAVYVRKGAEPVRDNELVPWVTERLREAYKNIMKPDQFVAQDHSVGVHFKGSGLDVDVVPIISNDDKGEDGFLVHSGTGGRILTSIPKHLQFIRKRKGKAKPAFAQTIRFIKWWKQLQVEQRDTFRLKSFMIELVVAKLLDRGLDLSDYPKALESVFGYIVRSGLKEIISFEDYYPTSKLPSTDGAPIRIYDPVNPQNNVAKGYTEQDRLNIVKAANQALEAMAAARFSTTKGEALDCWKEVLGPGMEA